MGTEAVGLGKGVLGGFEMLELFLRCWETAAANTRKSKARNDLVEREPKQWWSDLGRLVGIKFKRVIEVFIFILQTLS